MSRQQRKPLDRQSSTALDKAYEILIPKPDPELRGKLNGNCNREACQQPGAGWFNSVTQAYYCYKCAYRINYTNKDLGYDLCTRPEIDPRPSEVKQVELIRELRELHAQLSSTNTPYYNGPDPTYYEGYDAGRSSAADSISDLILKYDPENA